MHRQRVALITGCGKKDGIGSACARVLASQGITVVVHDVVREGVENAHNRADDLDPSWLGLDSLVAELEGETGDVASVLGDVSSEDDVHRIIQEIGSEFGRLDILVNNATAPQGADRDDVENVPVAAWDRVLGVSARGTFLLCRGAVPFMKERGWGRIINMSSRAALRPTPRDGAYAAAKAAVCGLTRSLALDLGASGITVNAVLPGPIATSRALSTSRRVYGDDLEEGARQRAKSIPVGRLGTPEEVAELVAYLASDSAGFITGQSIGIDGGP